MQKEVFESPLYYYNGVKVGIGSSPVTVEKESPTDVQWSKVYWDSTPPYQSDYKEGGDASLLTAPVGGKYLVNLLGAFSETDFTSTESAVVSLIDGNDNTLFSANVNGTQGTTFNQTHVLALNQGDSVKLQITVDSSNAEFESSALESCELSLTFLGV